MMHHFEPHVAARNALNVVKGPAFRYTFISPSDIVQPTFFRYCSTSRMSLVRWASMTVVLASVASAFAQADTVIKGEIYPEKPSDLPPDRLAAIVPRTVDKRSKRHACDGKSFQRSSA